MPPFAILVHRGVAVEQADLSHMSKACCHARAPILDIYQSNSALSSFSTHSNYLGHQLLQDGYMMRTSDDGYERNSYFLKKDGHLIYPGETDGQNISLDFCNCIYILRKWMLFSIMVIFFCVHLSKWKCKIVKCTSLYL